MGACAHWRAHARELACAHGHAQVPKAISTPCPPCHVPSAATPPVTHPPPLPRPPATTPRVPPCTGLRDFTINALFFDPLTGDVLDFLGGVADLKHKVRSPVHLWPPVSTCMGLPEAHGAARRQPTRAPVHPCACACACCLIPACCLPAALGPWSWLARGTHTNTSGARRAHTHARGARPRTHTRPRTPARMRACAQVLRMPPYALSFHRTADVFATDPIRVLRAPRFAAAFGLAVDQVGPMCSSMFHPCCMCFGPMPQRLQQPNTQTCVCSVPGRNAPGAVQARAPLQVRRPGCARTGGGGHARA